MVLTANSDSSQERGRVVWSDHHNPRQEDEHQGYKHQGHSSAPPEKPLLTHLKEKGITAGSPVTRYRGTADTAKVGAKKLEKKI